MSKTWMCFPCHKCGKLQGYTFNADSYNPPYTISLKVCRNCYPGERE